MCPSAAPTNATLPLLGAASASSAEPSAATGKRLGRDLKAAKALHMARHGRRDLRLAVVTECPECWGRNERSATVYRPVAYQRCRPCIDFRAKRIDAEEWNRRVLRTADKKVTG